jgi:hypothetical protein
LTLIHILIFLKFGFKFVELFELKADSRCIMQRGVKSYRCKMQQGVKGKIPGNISPLLDAARSQIHRMMQRGVHLAAGRQV